jgi:hypothetical protein
MLQIETTGAENVSIHSTSEHRGKFCNKIPDLTQCVILPQLRTVRKNFSSATPCLFKKIIPKI